MFCCFRLVLGLLLLRQAAAHVFLDGPAASQVLIRSRRANSFLEEMKEGNMERECVEERCDYEEAREIFEDKDKTDVFWAKYTDGDACESQPCNNGGSCKDGIGTYSCYCLEGYKGFNCQIVIPALCETNNGGCEHFCNVVGGSVRCSCADRYFLASDDKSCNSNEKFKCGALITGNVRSVFRYERNMTANMTTANMTMTNITTANMTTANMMTVNMTTANMTTENMTMENVMGENVTVNGIKQRDVLSSVEIVTPTVTEQRITYEMATNTRIVNGEDCPPGECPWQALLLNEDDQGFCGGTILNEYIILSAAHCMNQSRYIYVKLGEFDTLKDEGNEVAYLVETIVTHRGYQPNTYHNDIALIKLATPIKFSRYILPACLPEQDFAEKVLMNEPLGMVSGFGRLGEGRRPSEILQRLTVPYVDRKTCLASTVLKISTRMFCAGYDNIAKDACQGDSGGPHVTRYRDTYFVTGIVSWGEGCARDGKYGIYTQVSKFTRWIQEGINRLVPQEKNGARRKRNHSAIKRLVM